MRSGILPQPTGSINQGLRRVIGSIYSEQGGNIRVNQGLWIARETGRENDCDIYRGGESGHVLVASDEVGDSGVFGYRHCCGEWGGGRGSGYRRCFVGGLGKVVPCGDEERGVVFIKGLLM